MFTLVYEFKLKPTNAQIATFEEWLEQCRKVYNYALCERKHWVNSRKCPVNACSIKSEYIIPANQPAPTYNSQCENLTQAKKNIPALKQVHSQVLQNLQWKVDVPFDKLPSTSLRASPEISPTGTSLGIDVGLMHFAAVSNGQTFPNPRPFKRLESKLKSLQKKVSNKRFGSNNRAKAQAKVSRLHERIANTRKNYHWELAHNLCDWADMIFAEQLNLKGLARGMLSKSCLDAGWGQFLDILSQCCFKRGVYFQKVPAAGTSQTCPKCLKETGRKKLSQRVHKCQYCGYECDRDVAAAQVVELRGLEAVGHTVVKLSEGKGSILEDVKLCLPVTEESPRL
ncbi:Putative transposase DNA-binding domain family [Coleofasciculus chthonoplastes PCC 7420]|uniref:Putative transposase DNA-binding domain family n=1 Tax=Coleofasciculus chthonoplastes PCC 7420 TaxID=118168 RepID=B4W157_9CYAN|nr:RNA-guided endonuclease TnpB family protein [Coleofasciculus chthonoplastes]EDX72111.1 Putative transposase DNA-binding domain family [Coleofasciculus chthonoplastes PCC 7420]